MQSVMNQRAIEFEKWFKVESIRNPEVNAKRDLMRELARQMEARQGNYDEKLIASCFGVVIGYASAKGFLGDALANKQEYLASFLSAIGLDV